MPSIWDSIINQSEVRSRLKILYSSKIFPSAMVFTGGKGIGKEAVATAFTQSMNCELKDFEPCGICNSCKAVADLDTRFINFIFPSPKANNEKNTDEPFEIFDDNIQDMIKDCYQKKKLNSYFKILIPASNEIKINSIRRIKKQLTLAYPEVKKRVFIITEADRLNDESQNLLLKTLEEVSQNILFILITSSTNSILPTILSRSWEIGFKPLSSEIILNKLTQIYPRVSQVKLMNYISISNNNVNSIVEMINDEDEVAIFDFMLFFRNIYQKYFYQALQQINKSNGTDKENKYAALLLFRQLHFFVDELLKTQFNSDSSIQEHINLTARLEKENIAKIAGFLLKTEYMVESNINLNLIWNNLILIIYNSFLRKQ